ncbi:MAG: Rep family protein [Lachnospiraceae bacterium]|nr:hypothetical protein [Lachnospiraceae bacterium]MDD6811555.1 Rep family protein [Lachnospiraceae bacterium]
MQVRLCEIVSDVEHIDIEKIVKVLDTQKPFKDYAYILHNKDTYTEEDEKQNADHKAGTLKRAHYHIAIRLEYGTDTKYIANWLGIKENFINRVKGKWVDMLKYLTHENASTKYQYAEDEVISNYNWKVEKAKAINKTNSETRKIQIINDIVSGVIREFNYHEHITISEYDRYKKSIDNAFKYRTDIMKGAKRNMECVYITGKSGTGKSTYAKMMCEDKGYSVFVSSGSNDVLDGYAGQDCIILDDLRPSCMGLSDLLKMLDNNTASTVKSRYKNKVLECKLIIVTSVLKIDEFFNGVFKEQKEPIVQLKRRCKLHLRFEQSHYYASLFDDKAGDYSEEFEYVNPVATMYPKVELTDEEKLNYINNLLVAGAELIGKTEVPAPQSTDTLTPKEQDLQNKVAMLQRHNDLLMNELDKVK